MSSRIAPDDRERGRNRRAKRRRARRAATSSAASSFAAPPLAPGLYIVATPIGNLGDITIRALDTLAGADLVACEDTRVTRKLLDALRHRGEGRRLSRAQRRRQAHRRLLEALAEGRSVALVSDAGTPLISDPGARLVADAAAAGHAVVPIPGASAVMAALSAAGLPTDDVAVRSAFCPSKATARQKRLAEVARRARDARPVRIAEPHRRRCSPTPPPMLGGDAPAAHLPGADEAARDVRPRHAWRARGALCRRRA